MGRRIYLSIWLPLRLHRLTCLACRRIVEASPSRDALERLGFRFRQFDYAIGTDSDGAGLIRLQMRNSRRRFHAYFGFRFRRGTD